MLRSKLKVFELCIDSGRLTFAESGTIGVSKLTSSSSRIHIEALSLLSICYLRMKKVDDSKTYARQVISKINNIKSDEKRREYQKLFIDRIEEECIFSSLIESGHDNIEPAALQEKAVLLLQNNSSEEIMGMIGTSVPPSGFKMLQEMRSYTVGQVRTEDRKMLPPPDKMVPTKEIGKKAMAILKRIGWKALCHPDSAIYKLWSKKMPEVYSGAYFATAIGSVMKDWKISLLLLGAGIVAVVMQFSAAEFCALTKPQGIILSKSN